MAAATLRRHYVYIYFRMNGVPLLVGMGSGNRWLDTKRGRCKWFRNVLAKAGGSLPVVMIQEGLTRSEASDIEIKLIASIGRYPHGPLVNINPGGEGFTGRHTETSRAKMRLNCHPPSQRGVKQSTEQIEKRAAKLRGKQRSPEAIEASRLGQIGRVASVETRAKQRAAKLGKKQSEEHIESRTSKLRGRLRPEVGPKISAAKLGKKSSEETRATLRASNRSRDPEVRERIRQGTLASYARRRARSLDENRRAAEPCHPVRPG